MAKKMKNASLNFGHQVLRRKESHATDTPPSRRDDYASRRGERRASRRKGPLTPPILGYKCAAKMERRGWRLTPNRTRLAMSLCITARPPGGKRRGFRVCSWHIASIPGSTQWANAQSRCAPARCAGARGERPKPGERTPIAVGEPGPENRGVINLTQDGAPHERDQHRQSAVPAYARRHGCAQAQPAYAA